MSTIETTAAVRTRTPEPAPHQPRRFASGLATAMSALASWRAWAVSAATFGVVAGLFFASSAPFAIPQVEQACGQAPPDVRFFSSAAAVDGFLESCGEAGREAYRSMQLVDLFYPTVFALFVASSLALTISRLVPRHRALLALAALPFAAAAFDYLENAFAWLALAAFPEPAATNGLLGLASAAKSTTSWAAGLLLLGTLAALAATRGVRRLRGRAGDPTGAPR